MPILPILSWLKSEWRAIAIVLAFLGIFYAGYHVRGSFDQVTADKLLQDQIDANQRAQDDLNARSAKVEAELADERVKSSDLSKRWGKINATKHTVCMLPDSVISLLHDASSGQSDSTR